MNDIVIAENVIDLEIDDLVEKDTIEYGEKTQLLELIINAKNGDNDAVEELFDRFEILLWKLCTIVANRNNLHSKDKMIEPDDLKSIAYLAFRKAIVEYDVNKGSKPFPYYIGSVVSNKFHRIHYNSVYFSKMMDDIIVEKKIEYGQITPDGEDHTAVRDIPNYKELLDESNLTDMQRFVVDCIIEERVSMINIAKSIGCTREWVRRVYNESIDIIREVAKKYIKEGNEYYRMAISE